MIEKLGILFVLALTSLVMAPQAVQAELRAGAASRVITPQSAAYLAGLRNNRLSTGVHDPLYARSVVFDDGKRRVAFVSLDLIGLISRDVQHIQRDAQEAGLHADRIILTCTHVHSGPDTIGLWGPNELTSGVDPVYMDYLREQIVECLLQAQKSLQSARLRLGQTRVPSGIAWNARDDAMFDPTLGVMQFTTSDGSGIATVVNFAAHPEVLWSDSTLLTADYVAYVYQDVDRSLGGVTLFINGALGGMVTVDNRDAEGEDQHTFEQAERIGRTLAQRAIEAAHAGEIQDAPEIQLLHGTVNVPLENAGFQLLMSVGVLPSSLFSEGQVVTEVNVLQIGEAQVATFPGEALPRLAFEAKHAMIAPYKFVFGLANDELGYILHAEDYDRDLYDYERSMSMGREIGPATTQRIVELLGQLR